MSATQARSEPAPATASATAALFDEEISSPLSSTSARTRRPGLRPAIREPPTRSEARVIRTVSRAVEALDGEQRGHDLRQARDRPHGGRVVAPEDRAVGQIEREARLRPALEAQVGHERRLREIDLRRARRRGQRPDLALQLGGVGQRRRRGGARCVRPGARRRRSSAERTPEASSAAPPPASTTTSASSRSADSAEPGRRRLCGGFGRRALRGGRLCLLDPSIGRIGRALAAFARPRLIELHPPLALLALLQRKLRTERPPAAALEARHRLGRAARRDELARDDERQRLAGLRLPDDEAAAGILARPAGEALAVLDDVVAADGARTEVRARDAHVLQFRVELGDRGLREALDVGHEALARLLAALDHAQALLPVAGHRRRRQRVLAEQADDVQALLGRDERARLALDVADVDEALDDRRARRRRADARLLHRLAHLVVVDEAAGGLHRAQQRGVGVAPRRLGLLLGRR